MFSAKTKKIFCVLVVLFSLVGSRVSAQEELSGQDTFPYDYLVEVERGSICINIPDNLNQSYEEQKSNKAFAGKTFGLRVGKFLGRHFGVSVAYKNFYDIQYANFSYKTFPVHLFFVAASEIDLTSEDDSIGGRIIKSFLNVFINILPFTFAVEAGFGLGTMQELNHVNFSVPNTDLSQYYTFDKKFTSSFDLRGRFGLDFGPLQLTGNVNYVALFNKNIVYVNTDKSNANNGYRFKALTSFGFNLTIFLSSPKKQ